MAAAPTQRLGIRLAIATIALASTLVAHARIPAYAPDVDPVPEVPSPEGARLAALGFDSLVADFYWLRAVQVVGGEAVDPLRRLPLIAKLSELVVGLDPFVGHPYRFAALWMSDNPATTLAANRVLERGVAYHPTDWRNRFYLSFNYFFFLHDNESAARELAPAIGLPGAPRYLPRLLARLRSDAGDLEAAAEYLEGLLEHETDGWHRAEYEKALEEIETERRARFLDQAREHFEAQYGRDIDRVEDLAGPGGVIPQIPPELHGWEWVIDANSGKIVSSYYQRRYQINFQSKLGGFQAKGEK